MSCTSLLDQLIEKLGWLLSRIRFEDGRLYREESKEMARPISGGLLPNLGSSSLRPRN
jgi:hypothetical protein